MEGSKDNPREPIPSHKLKVYKDIQNRVNRTLANPFLLKEDKDELFGLANAAKHAVATGNPIIADIYKQFTEFTDPLMMPEKKQKKSN